MSFDLTYEGLKQASLWLRSSRSPCFDLTYEGLKQCFPHLRDIDSISFDLTYEGLKLITQHRCVVINGLFWSYLWGIETTELLSPLSPNRVLILPMRDWNRHRHSDCPRGLRPFWSYLWGIEIQCDLLSASKEIVLILPMRDWNQFNQYRKIATRNSFDLTYEGLK